MTEGSWGNGGSVGLQIKSNLYSDNSNVDVEHVNCSSINISCSIVEKSTKLVVYFAFIVFALSK